MADNEGREDNILSDSSLEVWDLPIRLFHWLLVLFFATAYASAVIAGFDPVHGWMGYGIVFLLFFRLIWGVIGSKYARFANFAFMPSVMFRHLFDIFRGCPDRFLGHSPTGAGYVFLMLGLLVMIAATGLVVEGYYEFEGPLYAMSMEPAHFWARTSRKLHSNLADAAVILAILHLVGVATAMIQHRENLVWSMINGFKPMKVKGEIE